MFNVCICWCLMQSGCGGGVLWIMIVFDEEGLYLLVFAAFNRWCLMEEASV